MTKDEERLLGLILVKLGAKLSALNKMYSDAAKYSRIALQHLQTNKGSIFVSLLFMDFESAKQYGRDELARKIAKNLTSDTDLDSGDMVADFERKFAQTPHSNRLSEVLKSLKDNNLLTHTKGNKETKDKGYRRPKKRGPDSVYELSPKALRIKNLLEKPEAIDILINGLTDSGLLPTFLKLVSKCSLYMIKDGNDKVVSQSFCMFSSNKSEEIPLAIQQVQVLKERLKSLDDKDIDKKAEELAKHLLPNMTDYIIRMALLYGVSELS